MLAFLIVWVFLWSAWLILAPAAYIALYAIYKFDGGRVRFFQWIKRI